MTYILRGIRGERPQNKCLFNESYQSIKIVYLLRAVLASFFGVLDRGHCEGAIKMFKMQRIPGALVVGY
jgi:hypothetical protein